MVVRRTGLPSRLPVEHLGKELSGRVECQVLRHGTAYVPGRASLPGTTVGVRYTHQGKHREGKERYRYVSGEKVNRGCCAPGVVCVSPSHPTALYYPPTTISTPGQVSVLVLPPHEDMCTPLPP